MKISIAMATYNGEKYIAEQLKSLLTQTRIPNEVIIVDDCSADATIEIINEFIAHNNLINWKVYTRVENQGYILTFREAINKCSGDIIFLSDHDDVWLENKIEIMADEINKNNNIHLLFCDYIVTDENLTIKDDRNVLLNNTHRGKLLLDKTEINERLYKYVKFPPIEVNGCCIAVVKALCDEYLAMPVYSTHHDLALIYLASLKDGLYFLNSSLIYHRFHAINASYYETPRNDIEKRHLAVKQSVMYYSDIPAIINKCGDISNETRITAKKKLSVKLRPRVVRFNFLEKQTFGSFIVYGLCWLRRNPSKIRTVALDVFLVMKKHFNFKGKNR